jgi:hypothetical protein
VYGVFYPTRTKNTNLRAGINFVFNKKPKSVKKDDKEVPSQKKD